MLEHTSLNGLAHFVKTALFARVQGSRLGSVRLTESQRVVSCCEAVTVSFYANVIAVEEDCLSCEMKKKQP